MLISFPPKKNNLQFCLTVVEIVFLDAYFEVSLTSEFQWNPSQLVTFYGHSEFFRPRQFLTLSVLYAFVCIDCTVCACYACVGRCTHSFCLKCQYVSEECDLLFIQNPRATFSKCATCLAIRVFALRSVKLLHNLPIACLSARQAQPLTQLSLPLRFFPPLLGDFFFSYSEIPRRSH